MQLTTPRHASTIIDYLRAENAALHKHEYRDGTIVAMAGNSFSHSLIAANLIGELHGTLKGKPCRVLDSNLRIGITRTPLYTYPDASVICGPAHFDPADTSGQTVTNPRVIIEILSPSTEAYDRGDKFTRYRQLESLEEYVLVSQETARIETFFRQQDGTWLFASTTPAQTTIRFASLGVDLNLSEIYAGVDFPPAREVPPDHS